jgi:hypothetical protein
MTATATAFLTMNALDSVVRAGIKGVPYQKKVHGWLRQVVETGDCDYIAHLKRSRPL